MQYGAGILPICPRTGRVLVLLRSEGVTYPLTWAAPGGGQEPSDANQPITTAIREFVEEAGIFPSPDILPLATLSSPAGEYHQFVSLVPFEFEPILNWENASAAWLDYCELMELPRKHPGFAEILADPVVQTELQAFTLHNRGAADV